MTPAGYIKATSNPRFRVVNDNNSLIVKVLDANGNGVDLTANMKVENASSASVNTKVNVGNTPGAPLPLTGGPGTRTLMLLGALITATCGTLAFRRLQQSRRPQSGSARG